VDPAWQSRSDWDIYKGFAQKFSEVCVGHLGVEKELVLTPLMHDTPAELAQPFGVADWKHGDCELIPGKTAPSIAVVVPPTVTSAAPGHMDPSDTTVPARHVITRPRYRPLRWCSMAAQIAPAERLLNLVIALVNTAGRMTKEQVSTRIQTSGITIDESSYSAKVHGKPLDLTYKEFQLLHFFATHPSRVFTREQLLSEVWGYDYFGGTRTVDVHVRRLRAKLGDLEQLIGTVRNVGYRFNVFEDDQAPAPSARSV